MPASICQGPFKARGATTECANTSGRKPQFRLTSRSRHGAPARRPRAARSSARMVANRCASRASRKFSQRSCMRRGQRAAVEQPAAQAARRRKRAADARKRCCYAYDLGPRVLSLSSRCFPWGQHATRADNPACRPAIAANAVGPPRLISQQRVRHVARFFEQIDIGDEIGKAQHRHAALPRAEQLAGTAHAQIMPRDFESVAASRR